MYCRRIMYNIKPELIRRVTFIMDENDRDTLVGYRLQQALETIELAKFLVENQKFVIAINRIYYGMYYALTALALKNSFETSK